MWADTTRRHCLTSMLLVAGGMAKLAGSQDTSILEGPCEMLRAYHSLDTSRPLPVPRCQIDDKCLQVDWNIAHEQRLAETIARIRVTEKNGLRIHTSNVNRLRYNVSWTTEFKSRNQAFEAVSTLFESVFPVGSLVGGFLRGQTPSSFNDWIWSLEYANQCLNETMRAFSGVVIDHKGERNRLRLHQVEQTLAQAMPKLDSARAKALENVLPKPGNSPRDRHLENYWGIAERHASLERRLAEFLPRARAAVEGVSTVLDTHKRNTTVVLTGQAFTYAGERVGEPVSTEYFVGTSRPMIYHLGYSYGRLKDFDFNQVRAASGQDLFSAIESTETSASGTISDADGEVVAFMSWEFMRRGPNDRYGTSLTMGTGLESPGESIYYGLSFRVFSRLLITSGAVTATATRGEGKVADATSDLTSRSLYSTVKDTISTRFFWSLSFRVY